MNRKWIRWVGLFLMSGMLVLVCVFVFAGAKTLKFAGYDWTVRPSGNGGPGPNDWSENNAWVDSSEQLHLKITKSNGKWYCADVSTTQRLGFGQYQWYVIGRVDELDKNVVFGLFPYLGPDGQNEIDIEMAKWGDATAKMGNFTVHPAKKGLSNNTETFPISLNGDYTTHCFNWQSKTVFFQMLHGHRSDNKNEIYNWNFNPAQYLDYIPQQPMPVHMNLWLHKGLAPSDGKEVEIVIKSFQYKK